ncbi:YjfA family protein [Kribbella sp. NBC_00709]|uniref:DUF2690 domain-containing protein n=1 Tax=Kribbella sp. NBC_00709 TaxID=2975972 RepID=UPI002E296689|nr:DUF2690 domain-containing protein [Kribbella sp. NBC_00709]
MRFLKVLLAGAVMLTAVFALGVPSAYAVGCYAETCYNKGPVAMGCTADQRVISQPASSGLEVRYSPACNAAWAWDNQAPHFWPIYLTIERARSDKIVQARLSIEFDVGEPTEWTNMFARGWYFRAVWDDRVSDENDAMTAWVFR